MGLSLTWIILSIFSFAFAFASIFLVVVLLESRDHYRDKKEAVNALRWLIKPIFITNIGIAICSLGKIKVLFPFIFLSSYLAYYIYKKERNSKLGSFSTFLFYSDEKKNIWTYGLILLYSFIVLLVSWVGFILGIVDS